jgi:hypothetical protein
MVHGRLSKRLRPSLLDISLRQPRDTLCKLVAVRLEGFGVVLALRFLRLPTSTICLSTVLFPIRAFYRVGSFEVSRKDARWSAE